MFSPPIVTHRSPKSICNCLPGGVSKRFRLQLPPQRRDFALDRAQAQLDAPLGQQLLAHDIGVAGMARNRSETQSSSPASARGRPRPRYNSQPPGAT